MQKINKYQFNPPKEVKNLCENIMKMNNNTNVSFSIDGVSYNPHEIQELYSKNYILSMDTSNNENDIDSLFTKFPQNWWTLLQNEDVTKEIDNIKDNFIKWFDSKLFHFNLIDSEFYFMISFSINDIEYSHYFQHDINNEFFFEIKSSASYGVKNGLNGILDFITNKTYKTFSYEVFDKTDITQDCVRFLYIPNIETCIKKGHSTAPQLGSLISKEQVKEHLASKVNQGYSCLKVQETLRLKEF